MLIWIEECSAMFDNSVWAPRKGGFRADAITPSGACRTLPNPVVVPRWCLSVVHWLVQEVTLKLDALCGAPRGGSARVLEQTPIIHPLRGSVQISATIQCEAGFDDESMVGRIAKSSTSLSGGRELGISTLMNP